MKSSPCGDAGERITFTRKIRNFNMRLELPRVLVISDSCICAMHGTGVVLLRHFSEYPSDKLFNAYWKLDGEPEFARSQLFEQSSARGENPLRKIVLRLY